MRLVDYLKRNLHSPFFLGYIYIFIFSNYNAANMLVKASRPILVQSLHLAYTYIESYNENPLHQN